MSSNSYVSSIELQETAPSELPQPSVRQLPLPASPEGALENDERAVVEQRLEPADGGRAAWTLLCVMFVFEALFWGNNSNLTTTMYFAVIVTDIGSKDFLFPLAFSKTTTPTSRSLRIIHISQLWAQLLREFHTWAPHSSRPSSSGTRDTEDK